MLFAETVSRTLGSMPHRSF